MSVFKNIVHSFFNQPKMVLSKNRSKDKTHQYRCDEEIRQDVSLIGERRGRLTIVSRIGNYDRFECKCDCGNSKIIAASDLKFSKKRGGYRSKSCGCIRRYKTTKYFKNKTYDLIGKRFWKLVVESRIDKSDTFICRCDCGNSRNVRAVYLNRNQARSCGCSKRKYDHIIGQRFGRLTVVGKQKSAKVNLFVCKCDCGKITLSAGYRLVRGIRVSCGCLNKQMYMWTRRKLTTSQFI